ncbi:MAG: hypothetical protein KatS3mg103_0972 [Phycisphaerales bacterium]|nr:MAG: hypothetical protein KatS3mg103_0972 [Phycisphaerales bacterium]
MRRTCFGREFLPPHAQGPGLAGAHPAVPGAGPASRGRQTSFYQVANLLFGELNGSHLGIWGGTQLYDPPAIRTGYLGIDAKPVQDGYEVAFVYPEGPAWREASRLHVGGRHHRRQRHASGPRRCRTVDGPGPGPWPARAGLETLLDVRPADPRRPRATSLIVPTSSSGDVNLRYEEEGPPAPAAPSNGSRTVAWATCTSAAMNEPSVRDFERDLYAAANGKDGPGPSTCADNGGGLDHRHPAQLADGAEGTPTPCRAARRPPARAQGCLPARPPAESTPTPGPSPSCATRTRTPTAEIFSHAIKTIGRGPLVGRQTYGAVISTGSYRLIDGTTVRRPFRGWVTCPTAPTWRTTAPRPDVPVRMDPSDEAQGGRSPAPGRPSRAVLDQLGDG